MAGLAQPASVNRHTFQNSAKGEWCLTQKRGAVTVGSLFVLCASLSCNLFAMVYHGVALGMVLFVATTPPQPRRFSVARVFRPCMLLVALSHLGLVLLSCVTMPVGPVGYDYHLTAILVMKVDGATQRLLGMYTGGIETFTQALVTLLLIEFLCFTRVHKRRHLVIRRSETAASSATLASTLTASFGVDREVEMLRDSGIPLYPVTSLTRSLQSFEMTTRDPSALSTWPL